VDLWDRLQQALARLPEEIEADRRQAPALLAELLGEDATTRQAMAVTLERFRSVALTELLFERALQAGASGAYLAELALAIAGVLDNLGGAAGQVEQARARSWAALGNAHRLEGRLERAAAAFERAAFHLASSPDPLEESLFYRLKALLLRDRGDLEAAIAVQDRAVELLVGFGRPAPGAIALLVLAALHLAAEDAGCTIECLGAAAALLGSELAGELAAATRPADGTEA
jgi:tetratricopeptide (TPR) repeat protein